MSEQKKQRLKAHQKKLSTNLSWDRKSLNTINKKKLIIFRHLTDLDIWGSFTNNGLIISLSLYPIKYLNELFLPYNTFLETNILLRTIPSILNVFLFLLL